MGNLCNSSLVVVNVALLVSLFFLYLLARLRRCGREYPSNEDSNTQEGRERELYTGQGLVQRKVSFQVAIFLLVFFFFLLGLSSSNSGLTN